MTIYSPISSTELAAITTAAGDVVQLRTGTIYAASSVPAGLLSPNNVTLGYTGTGSAPVISGGTVRSDWTYDAGNDVYSRPAYSSEVLGNVTEDGVMMKWVAWNANLATTAAAMNAGQSLPAWSGSMTWDTTNKIVYIRPSSGLASEHTYIVSDNGNTIGAGLQNSTASTGLLIDGIAVEHISRHAILLYQKRSFRIQNTSMRYVGGARPGSLYLGNGMELSYGCHGARIAGCTATDIFDSGFTSQLYESTPQTITDHKYTDCKVERFGMHGIEVSVQTANQRISDIEIDGLTLIDQGTYGWSGDRNGSGVTCLSNSLNSSRITRAFARNVTGTRLKRLYLGYQHGGVCGIEESSATSTWGQNPQSSANGATDHRDLWRAVTDNLGSPSGGAWVAATAPLCRSLHASWI
jgi:hypothetical protein